MAINSQILEILGWLFITLFPTILVIIFTLLKPKLKYELHLIGFIFVGYLIGSLLLYYSKDYGIYAFSFLAFYIFKMFLIIILISTIKNLKTMVFLDYGMPVIAIVFGIYFQTKIWFITATLLLLVTMLQYLAMTFERPDMSNSINAREIISGFMPGLIIPFASIFYLFNLGILDYETLNSFYGIFIQGFFTLLGIVAMFGLFILEKIEFNKVYFSKLFKGLIVLYILAILVSTLGLITIPRNLDTGYIDLSYDALVPDIPIKERQLSDSSQIFEEIIFTTTLGLLLCSLAYLCKMVFEILSMRDNLDHITPEHPPDAPDLSDSEIQGR
jgi:hypothetical protein